MFATQRSWNVCPSRMCSCHAGVTQLGIGDAETTVAYHLAQEPNKHRAYCNGVGINPLEEGTQRSLTKDFWSLSATISLQQHPPSPSIVIPSPLSCSLPTPSNQNSCTLENAHGSLATIDSSPSIWSYPHCPPLPPSLCILTGSVFKLNIASRSGPELFQWNWIIAAPGFLLQSTLLTFH